MLDKLEKILQDRNVFLSGGAGVGKSFLTNQLKFSYRKQNKKLVALGSSALSAFNVGGVTLHSFFCLGRMENFEDLKNYDRLQKNKLKKLEKVLSKLDLIIIDEVSMVSATIFDMVALRLKNSGFSGKILLVGDFFQLPPVVKEKQNSLFVNTYYAFASLFWEELRLKNVKLSVPKRTDNAEFYEHLSLLREGYLREQTLDYFEKMLIKTWDLETLDDGFTLLCGINKRVNVINEQKLAKINAPLLNFKAKFEKKDENLSDGQFMAWVSGLGILEELKIKVGARIIFCMNNFEQNYYNGEQGIIEDIVEDERGILLQIMKNNGQMILLEPYIFELSEFKEEGEELDLNIRASVVQYPIKLAYAITIHKSQGMSIEKLVCDIDHIFENGQLYVALSRATNPQSLKILYSKNWDFRSYFERALKFDENVSCFYKENDFIDLEL
ncbi:ATP-dependent RecD-like DNA helicase [Campylobacter upsaliensis]